MMDPPEDQVELQASTAMETEAEPPAVSVYRCKKCRRLVATQGDIIEHAPRTGAASFARKKRGGFHLGDEARRPVCSSIFVGPKEWMTSVAEGEVEGKLFCVSCQARLGNFNWAGMQCSCGSWVNPAFQLHKSRMDAAWS